MRTLRHNLAVIFLIAVIGVPASRAQQDNQQQTPPPPAQSTPDQAATPIPAYHSPLASAADNDDSETPDQDLTPDNTSLSGVQALSLGMKKTRSYWQPNFTIFSTVDSNPVQAPGASNWNTWTTFSGGIDVHRNSGTSMMTLSYTGGDMIANSGPATNGVEQGLYVVEKLSLRRSTISILDQLNYLPESAFGFNGLGGGGNLGGEPGGIGTVFTPGQTLLAGFGQSLSNAFAVEDDVYLTPRASLTFAGGYSLLHYFDSGLLNYGDVTFRAGYNYQMTRKDTIALMYTYSGFRYSNFDQSIDDHAAQVSYGRRVTGRLAFQVAAGPQVVVSHIPIAGAAGSPGGGIGAAGSTTQVSWALNSSVQYQLEQTQLSLAYMHGVAGGAGALAGSNADTLTGTATRQVSRTFAAGITGGFSRNQGLAIGMVNPANQTFDYWFGGANLGHPIGRTLSVNLSYQLQYQNLNAGLCTGPMCGNSVIRHLITFGVTWRERPLLF
jgi:hypothetical protein